VTTAPPEDQRRLLDVQALDTRAAQVAHQRRTLPVLARLAELDTRIADVQASLVASRTAASDLRREVAKAEADVEQVRGRATRDQSKLDSGQGSPKDLQALQHELVALGRRQSDLEDIELEVMERLEAHEAALAELTEAARVLEEQKAEAQAERERAVAELDTESARVAEARTAAVEGIDAGLLTLYDKLRGQLGGLGAAELRGRRCEGCRLELNATDLNTIRAAAPDQVVRCEECGRILVRLPEPARD
jgi:predicted  nucleic acid-binding Zn-ribbon protein